MIEYADIFLKKKQSAEYVRTLNVFDEGFVELFINFHKLFVENTRKRVPGGKHFGVFFPRHA